MQLTNSKVTKRSAVSASAINATTGSDDASERVHSASRRRLIGAPEVMEITGLCRAMIYKLMKQDAFPKPVRITNRRVGWVEAEVALWFDAKVAARDAALGA